MKDIIKIVRYTWGLKRYYLATIILAIITTVLNQVTPFLLKFIVSGILKLNAGQFVPLSYFEFMLLGILIVSVLATLISNVAGYIGDLLSAKLTTTLSQRYYDHVLKLPLAYYDNEIAGRITSRLERSIVTISNLIQAFTNNFIGMILTIISTLAIVAFYAWPVAILLAILFPIYIWLTTLSSRAWQAKQQLINQDIDYANGRVIESIGSIRVVKSFVQEALESRIFKDKRASVENHTQQQSLEWHKYDILRRFSLDLIFFLIICYIVIQLYLRRFGLDTFTLLLQMVIQARFPLFASSFIVDQVQRAQAGSKDFFEVMDTEPEIIDAPGAGLLKVPHGKIEYQKVSFEYESGRPVLSNIDFEIGHGSKLALVGESGEGKTTIANLLLRFYEPTSGQVLIDGVDIATVTQASLREKVAVVFQEPTLFSGTLAENIRYGKPKATKTEVEAAAKAGNAHDFIMKLPKGYDTEIGERGVKLSGGQKQRIAIARALLKDAPILILDEATSSLDSKAEREVQDALEVLMRDRTTMIIAHRLSTIQNVDMIVGIRGGEVIEAGSPSELAKGDGIYAELLKLQTPTKANKAKLKKYDLAK